MYTEEREKALGLRSRGLGVGEIAKKLGIGKTTVSYWCRRAPLSLKQQQALKRRGERQAVKVLFTWSQKKRDIRIAKTAQLEAWGRQDVGRLSLRDLHIAGLCLYWGEGYKNANGELGFSNSDPAMILFFIHWLKKIYRVERARLTLRVSVNSVHEHRQQDILNYWSGVTGVSLSQFTKTSLIKSATKKTYGNESVHYGVLRVKVQKATDLRRRIMGAIDQLKIYTN